MIATAGYAQAEHARQEAGRQLIVRLVFIIFLLLIFEGALRKWVLPGLQRPLYFSRDPFVLLIYVCVLLNGLILRSRMLVVLGLFAVPVSVFTCSLPSSASDIRSPGRSASTITSSTFRSPSSSAVAFASRIWRRLIRLNLLLAIPIAILVFVQYHSRPSAFVNRALAHDIDKVTYVAGDILRPYGTFTSDGGNVLYTAVSVTMLAAAWITGAQMRLPLWLILPSTGATMVMALTTGSRSIWFFLGYTALCLVAAVLSGSRSGLNSRALGFVLLMTLGTVALYASVLAPAYQAMVDRLAVATRSEGSLVARPEGMVTHVFEILDETPITGSGLGSGILGAVAVITGERHFALAEGEWDRIVLELGPVLGLLFIGLRIVLVAWLLRRALLANRMYGNPAGLLLFGFVGPHLLVGQITMSGEGAMFAWLFVGLILAATNPWSEPAGSANFSESRESGS